MLDFISKCIFVRMLELKTQIEEILSKHKLRKTNVRVGVLHAFLENAFALTHNEIENQFDYIDRITLYRTLKTFEEKGIIHLAPDGTDTNKYALCNKECNEHSHNDYHAHFSCKTCNTTICLEEVTIPNIKIPSGFVLENSNIILTGKCQKCSA